jgi:hypothetical protein
MANSLDWKLNSTSGGQPYAANLKRRQFYGGINITDTYTDYAYQADPGYALYVKGDIGATSNITAYADYVCDDCGWHSAREAKICPTCGSNNVHYHDDVELLKQIIDITASPDQDIEKQYEAYQKLAKLGVIDIQLDGSSNDGTGLREKDISITHNLHALNNYFISSLVQERKKSDNLEDRIDKLEYIIETMNGEPGSGNTSPNGSYDKEEDLRLLTPKPRYNSSGGIGKWMIHGGFHKIVQKFKKKLF